MEKLCESLGYSFNDRRLLVTALTHPSYGGDHHVPHYQRLEFLGDAVLELTMSEYLFEKLPEVDEGKLTRIRAAIVREETLARAAKRISLGGMIRLSVGEERTGGREKASILSDVMEAVFAAVYLDGGFECAKATILRVMREESESRNAEGSSGREIAPSGNDAEATAQCRNTEFVSMEGRRACAGISLSGVFERRAAGRGQRNEQAGRSAGGCEGRAE